VAEVHSIVDLPSLPENFGIEIRHCPGHAGYAVGNDGSMWSCLKRGVRWRPGVRRLASTWHRLRCATNGTGYVHVIVRTDSGRSVTRFVHHLVLEAFVGNRPVGCETLHFDGVRKNNNLSNLRWGTPSENRQDSIRHGTLPAARRGGAHMAAKLSDDDARTIRELKSFLSQAEIARLYNVTPSCISYLASRVLA